MASCGPCGTHRFRRRSQFRTHYFNRQSRAGIERLGAKLDGVLRQHLITNNGTLRDTCVYSILDREWPTVKTHLGYQLNRRPP
jgi:RimJ/RimL family protein N-acetyltransferase